MSAAPSKAVRSQVIVLQPKWVALADYKRTKFLFWVALAMSAILFLLYPPASIVPAMTYLAYFLQGYAEEYDDPVKLPHYEKMFAPKVTTKHLVQIGFEVWGNELQEHLNLVTDENKIPELAAKQEMMKRNPYRQVGLSAGFLKEHIWAIGKTGSGKTSLAVTLINEAMKANAGVLYVDGKGEIKNAHWLYTLAMQMGREHEFFVVNYREPSKSNKFNPLEGLGPEALAEFFFSLLPAPSGDQEYWQGRGKTLFRPVAYFYYMRQRYWDEPFTFETLSSALDKTNFSFMCAATFALIRALNDKLESDPRIRPFIEEAKKFKLPQSEYQAVELLTSYFMQMPYMARQFESYGYDRRFLTLLYRVYSYVETYTSSVAGAWKLALAKLGDFMVQEAKSSGGDIMELNITELRQLYMTVRENLKQGGYGVSPEEAKQILAAADLTGDDLGGDPTQHQYAQQQWDNLMSTFTTYEDIFKSMVSDFNLLHAMRNGQIIFFVFPAMDKSESTMRTLAKVIVRVLSNAISESLGKDFEVTQTQRKIIESIAKPKPLAMVILDEYGSYAVEGVETIAAQARSLNYSLVILSQDYTSARPGEGREQPAARLWANTSKIIFGVMDNEAVHKVAETLAKQKRVVTTSYVDTGSGVVEEVNRGLSDEEVFVAQNLVNFANGFAIIITKTEAEPVIVQCYYSPQIEHERGYEVEYKLTKLKALKSV